MHKYCSIFYSIYKYIYTIKSLLPLFKLYFAILSWRLILVFVIIAPMYFLLNVFPDNLCLFIVPVVTYNADQDKNLLMKQNKGKSGIYRWVHIESEKSYIGSSINLYVRFSQYFNYNHLSDEKQNMSIYKALLKYGYAAFSLEIL